MQVSLMKAKRKRLNIALFNHTCPGTFSQLSNAPTHLNLEHSGHQTSYKLNETFQLHFVYLCSSKISAPGIQLNSFLLD